MTHALDNLKVKIREVVSTLDQHLSGSVREAIAAELYAKMKGKPVPTPQAEQSGDTLAPLKLGRRQSVRLAEQ